MERVTVRDAAGHNIGSVRFYENGGTVRVRANLHGLTRGFHGFHIHETAQCDPDAPEGVFKSAGGHYHADDTGHHGGRRGHEGDMPSLYVAADGTAKMAFLTDRFTLEELTGGDGSAVMVHVGRDNFGNIPERYTSSLSGKTGPDTDTKATGDAGDRFACGLLTQQ
jgi:Cu-Zn family superoxide dismutase